MPALQPRRDARAPFLATAFLRWIFLALGCLTLVPLWAQDEEEPNVAQALSTATRESIVSIEQWTDSARRRTSVVTGFWVAPDPKAASCVLTYFPSLTAEDTFVVALGRTMVKAELAAIDPHTGLALLSVKEAVRPALAIAPQSLTNAQAGEPIFLLDNACSQGAPAYRGRFAGREAIQPLEPSHLRLNIAAPNGSAGSPIFDAQQRLIGLLTTPVPAMPEACYALPAERLLHFLQDVRLHGQPQRTWLGIARITASTGAPRIPGCRPNSPAQRAGLEPNDLVLAIGPTKITTVQDLIDTTDLLTVDEPVDVKILRGPQLKTLRLTPSLKLTMEP